MVEAFSRHHFLNHRTAIIELLMEIKFINNEKAQRISREIEKEIIDYKDFSFFYFDKGHLVGLLFARPKHDLPEIGKTMYLRYLAVSKDYQGKGISKALMDFLISSVKFSYANIYLSHYEKNHQAQKFYRKFGFVPYKVSRKIQSVVLDKGTIDEHIDIFHIKRMPLRNVLIRPLRSSNVDFLKEMTFQALYSEGELFDRAILESKDISKYYKAWDSKKEIGYIARYDDKDIGAIWCRFFPFYDQGYGYVDDKIPEMSIAVFEPYRGRGLGQELIDHLFARLRHQGIRAVSLSVDHRNPARILYEKLGFVLHKNTGKSNTMFKKL